jgi:hypothetical protein
MRILFDKSSRKSFPPCSLDIQLLGCVGMRPHIVQHIRLVAVAIGVILTAILGGCASTESKQLAVIQGSDSFFKAYLDGDASRARQSLNQMIQYFQSQQADILGPSGQAGYLFVVYARLYVLEMRVGNKDQAEAALTKAQYWHLQNYESDASWRSRVPLHEFLSYQTPDWFVEIVDKLDKGREPKYIESLSRTQPNAAPKPTATVPSTDK